MLITQLLKKFIKAICHQLSIDIDQSLE